MRSRSRLSDEELGTLLQIGEEEGTLYQGEAEMIQEIIKLGDKTAKDCMHGLRPERAIKLDRWFVPIEHRPFHPAALTLPRDLRKLHQ